MDLQPTITAAIAEHLTYLFNKTGLKAYALAGCHEEGIAGIMAPEQCPPPLEPAAICLKTLT
jgi:hypothetical protein